MASPEEIKAAREERTKRAAEERQEREATTQRISTSRRLELPDAAYSPATPREIPKEQLGFWHQRLNNFKQVFKFQSWGGKGTPRALSQTNKVVLNAALTMIGQRGRRDMTAPFEETIQSWQKGFESTGYIKDALENFQDSPVYYGKALEVAFHDIPRGGHAFADGAIRGVQEFLEQKTKMPQLRIAPGAITVEEAFEKKRENIARSMGLDLDELRENSIYEMKLGFPEFAWGYRKSEKPTGIGHEGQAGILRREGTKRDYKPGMTRKDQKMYSMYDPHTGILHEVSASELLIEINKELYIQQYVPRSGAGTIGKGLSQAMLGFMGLSMEDLDPDNVIVAVTMANPVLWIASGGPIFAGASAWVRAWAIRTASTRQSWMLMGNAARVVKRAIANKPSLISDMPEGMTVYRNLTRPDAFRKIAELPIMRHIMGTISPQNVLRDPIQGYAVLRAWMLAAAKKLSRQDMHIIDQFGVLTDVWGPTDHLHRLVRPGKPLPLTGAKGAPAYKHPLDGIPVSDIMRYPSRYSRYTTRLEREWMGLYDRYQKDLLASAKRAGIDIGVRATPEKHELSIFVSRKIYAKVDKLPSGTETVRYAYDGPPPRATGKAGLWFDMPKNMDVSEAEALEAGWRSLDPIETLAVKTETLKRYVSEREAVQVLQSLIPDVMVRNPAEVAQSANMWRIGQHVDELNLARIEKVIQKPDAPLEIIRSNTKLKAPLLDEQNYSPSNLRAFENQIQAGLKANQKKIDHLLDVHERHPMAQHYFPRNQKAFEKLKRLEESNDQKLKEFLSHKRSWKKAIDDVKPRNRLEGSEVVKPFFENIYWKPGLKGDGLRMAERVDRLLRSFGTKDDATLPLISKLNMINSVGRAMALTMDMSVITIQLQFVAGYPIMMGHAFTGMVRAMADTKFRARYMAKHADTVRKNPNALWAGGGGTEFTELNRVGGLFGRGGPTLTKSSGLIGVAEKTVARPILKVTGGLVQPFQRGFETAIDVAGVEWLRALEPLIKTDADRHAMNAFVNAIRGLSDSKMMNVNSHLRAIESLGLLAPRYFRAMFALQAMVFQGGLRGRLARNAMARGQGAIHLYAYAISLAKGESPEEAINHILPFRPDKPSERNPYYLTWRFGDSTVGFGGKQRSIFNLITTMAQKAAQDPRDVMEWFIEPSTKFMINNLSPLASIGKQTYEGTTWNGESWHGENILDSTKNWATQVAGGYSMPFWLHGLLFEKGSREERVKRGTFDFMGGRTYPLTPSQRYEQALIDAYQRETGKTNVWPSEVEYRFASNFRTKNKFGRALYQAKIDDLKGKEKINPYITALLEVEELALGRISEQVASHVDLLEPEGTDVEDGPYPYIREYYREYGDYVATAIEIARNSDSNKEALEELEKFTARKEEVQGVLWSEYMAIITDPSLDDPFWGYDFLESDRRVEEFKERIGKDSWEDMQAIRDDTRSDLPTLVQRYLKEREELRPYWAILDNIIDERGLRDEYNLWRKLPRAYKDAYLDVQSIARLMHEEPLTAEDVENQTKAVGYSLAQALVDVQVERTKMESEERVIAEILLRWGYKNNTSNPEVMQRLIEKVNEFKDEQRRNFRRNGMH
jgi:hypothetical protein